MNNKVVNILEKQPHLEGTGYCLHCKHEWPLIAPIGVLLFECPQCSLLKGVLKALCAPEVVWECNCGCKHFFIYEKGALCCNCGLTHQDFAI